MGRKAGNWRAGAFFCTPTRCELPLHGSAREIWAPPLAAACDAEHPVTLLGSQHDQIAEQQQKELAALVEAKGEVNWERKRMQEAAGQELYDLQTKCVLVIVIATPSSSAPARWLWHRAGVRPN